MPLSAAPLHTLEGVDLVAHILDADQVGSVNELRGIAARQHGVFSLAQAKATGVTRHEMAHRVAAGAWSMLDATVIAIVGSPDTWMRRVWAAYLSRPEALVTGRSAAHLYGFPGVGVGRPQILVPFRGNARSPLARIIRSRYFEIVEANPIDGLFLTSRAETLFFLSLSSPPLLIERWVDSQMAVDKLSAQNFDGIFARYTNARVRVYTRSDGSLVKETTTPINPPPVNWNVFSTG